MEQSIVRYLKTQIDRNDLEYIQTVWQEYKEYENYDDIAWDVVFKDVYIHACLKGKKEIVEWLDELYKEFDPIIQIALRQMFPYARMLMRKSQKL
jgi:hypothetical protein